MDRTDQILDEIDALVDDSLARGDQSGSFRGERYDKCPLCGDDYHFFAITQKLQEMRHGSYGRDEFNQGIVDPDYRHSEDTSPIICPGSNYLGPPIGNREWGWYLRRTGSRPAPRFRPRSRVQDSSYPPEPRRSLRATNHPIMQWRFKGPFDPWVVEMRTDIEYESDPAGGLFHPRITGSHQIATFFHQDPFRDIPGPQWVEDNREDIEENGFSFQNLEARMKPISFRYINMNVHALSTEDEYPQYVEFRTDYPIWVHQWWLPFWELIGPTGQPVPLKQTTLSNGRTVSYPPGINFIYRQQPLRVTMNVNDASILEGFIPLGFTEGATSDVHQDRPS